MNTVVANTVVPHIFWVGRGVGRDRLNGKRHLKVDEAEERIER